VGNKFPTFVIFELYILCYEFNELGC